MRKTTLLAAVAAGAIMLSGSASAAVIFGDGYGNGLSLYSNGYADAQGASTQQSTYAHDEQFSSTLPVGAFASEAYAEAFGKLVTGPVGHKVSTVQATATADEAVTATFASAAAATFEFLGATTADVTSASGSAEAYNYTQNAYYSFRVDTDSILTINYSLAETYPYYYYYYQNYGAVNDTIYGNIYSNYFGYNTTGSSSPINLLAGHTYQLSLSTGYYSDYIYQSGAGSNAGSHDEIYDWEITPVTSPSPEPAAWALMLMGFGGLGAMLRRNRGLALAA